jgi:hypothetical protein
MCCYLKSEAHEVVTRVQSTKKKEEKNLGVFPQISVDFSASKFSPFSTQLIAL